VSGSRFDRTADRYLEQARRRDWSAVVELCRPGAGDRALDVGAGPGLLSAALAPRVARAVALDPSPAMLERAPAGVETAEGTGEAIPFEDGSFDLVTAVNTLHHVADMPATVAEMVRVLAPAGRIVVQDYLADPDPDAAERWERVERLRDHGHRNLPRAGEVEQLLAGHGLAMDEQQTWTSSWQLDPWLEMADPSPEVDAEIRRLVGADSFTQTAWRARFLRGRGLASA
jgi:ubiquinone/menaquinone biosynthesis C-methylase UbiE